MAQTFQRFAISIALFLVSCSAPSKSMPTLITFPASPQATISHPNVASTPTRTLEPIVPTDTATSVPPTFTLTPSPVVSTATPGTALPPENIILYKPLEIIPSLPADIRPSGALVLGGSDSFILHFDETLRLEPIEEQGCLSASPDGQWLTYCTGNRRLYIESADRQQHNTIWLEHNLLGPGWVNNRLLVFSSLKEYNGGYPVVVVDPFTGRHKQSPTDFPGFAGGIYGPGSVKYQFGFTSLVYDPTQTLIVYPDMSNPAHIVLWDFQAEKVLAKIEENICFGNYPLWSPDGLRFVVAIDRGNQKWLEEWASGNREGQVEWLTHFANYFEEANVEFLDISEVNWSPDNRRVAFGLFTKPDTCSSEEYVQNLAVLDVDTRHVVNYCLSGFDSLPVWSLDGRYIAIRKFDDKGIGQILLVDPEQGWAATIAGPDLLPVGWLDVP